MTQFEQKRSVLFRLQFSTSTFVRVLFIMNTISTIQLLFASPTDLKYFKVGFLPALANKGQNKHFVGAFQYALEDINEKFGALGYVINSTTRDNKADTAESLRIMTSMYFNDVIAFIGPEDTCAIEARLAAAWNLPLIAFVSTFL